MSKFDWNDLQAFLAIARVGRLTVAAKQMGIDHSTLSRKISNLENSLGVTLFERRSIGFSLTPEGHELLADAETIETLAVKVQAKKDNYSANLTGTIRIGMPEGFGTYFLTPRIHQLSELHPELQIEVVANPSAFSLSKREADLAISMARPTHGRIYAEKLVDYSLGIYASSNYAKKHSSIFKKETLNQHRWIGYVEDLMWTPELDYLPQIHPNINPHLRISNVISQMSAIVGGAGIGVLPHFIARTNPNLTPLFPEEIRLLRSYWLVAHADSKNLIRIETVKNFIQEEVKKTKQDYWITS